MEEFKRIAAYPDYDVNKSGVVRSWKSGEPKVLTQYLNEKGYWRVNFRVDGKPKHFPVHRLVAETFIPNPDNLPQVNHINGIKTDNRVENLEWCTASENQRHAFVNGLNKGRQLPRVKFTAEQTAYIRDNPDNLSRSELAEMFGVSKDYIFKVQTYRKNKLPCWKNRKPNSR